MTDGQPSEPWIFHPLVWAAGLAGAMVSLAHVKGLNAWQKVMTLVAGTLTAGFLTPGLAEGLKLGVNAVAAAGFLLGLAAMTLTAVVVNAAKYARDNPAVAAEWARGLLLRWLGGAAPPAPPAAPPEDKK